MTSVNGIFEFLKKEAPLELKMDFDNPGLLIGEFENEVDSVLVCLDITSGVIDEAVALGTKLIVAHHPLFFNLKRIVDNEVTGKNIIKLIKNGVSAICMHTNLDAVTGGVNDVLAKILGLTNTEILAIDGTGINGDAYGIGRTGVLEKAAEFETFLKTVKTTLNAGGLRYYNAGKPVKKVAVGGGSCGDYLEKAYNSGCDTFVTADIKHNIFINAFEYGVNLIDAGHFWTEDVICPVLVRKIKEAFPAIDVKKSESCKAFTEFYV